MNSKGFVVKVFMLLIAIGSAQRLYCAPDESLAVRSILHETNEVISKNPPTKTDFEAGVRVLSAGLKEHPTNNRLLRKRANLYLILHEYRHAKNDLDRMTESAPLAPELSLTGCMLEERLNGLIKKAQQCYDNVVETYENRNDTRAEPEANYVVAALLANSPDAEQLRAAYVNATADEPVMRGLIEQFDRERYLKQVLP